jgi:hypothetical protein
MSSFARLVILGVVTLVVPGMARAQVVNGGFETGTFTGWSVTGTGYVVGAVGTPAIVPPGGVFQAALQTSDQQPFGPDVTYTLIEDMNTFFGLPAGTLEGLAVPGSFPPTAGTAIMQSVTVSAGQTLSFRWNYVTREAETEELFNDYSFVVIGGTAVRLMASNDPDNGPLTGPLVDIQPGEAYRTSDYQTFNFTFNSAGTFNIGVGVTNVGDTGVSSGLMVDNFVISAVPEPTTWALLGISVVGGVGGVWRYRRRVKREQDAAMVV